ncbi:MAG TPA: hypothetical protein VGJ44_19370 [Kribbellaceae bacterium]
MSSAIPTVVGLLVAVGVLDLTPDQATTVSDAGQQAVAGVLTVVSLLTTIVATVRARSKVTPLASPRNSEGVNLVAAGRG